MKRKNYPTTRVILSLCFLIGLTGFHPLLAQGKQDWVAKSDAYTAKLLEVMARHNPESAARIGVEGHDEEISDLSAGFREKELKDLEDAHAYLLSEYEKERDRALKQDLQILISSVSDGMESSALEHAQLLPYHPVAGNIYHGIKSLLEDRVPAERREAALVRLRKYAGTEKGYRPYPVLAMEDMQREWTSQPDRLPPFKDQLERDLTTSRQYMEEIGTLFEKYGIGGYQKDYKVLKEQLERYENYLRETILPQARTDFRLPRGNICTSNLKDYGVDMPIDELQRSVQR
jgi:hypothetical protein